MSHCCDIPNPLIRDGVSQRQRQAPALPPDTIRVDERHLTDFLVLGYQLAQQVIYTDINNLPAGDWRAFFTTGTPLWIALISKTPWQTLNQTYRQQLAALAAQPSPQTLRPILHTWATLLSQVRLWFEALQNDTPLKATIRGLVKTNLAEPLRQMQGFDRAYALATGAAGIPPDFYPAFARTFGLGRTTAETFYSDFAHTFGLTLGTAVADATPLTGSPEQAQQALEAVFQVLFQNYRQIIQQAPQYLIPSLAARQDHQPHLALYISFVEVLKHAQVDLNRMTQRHLDFFYRQVLQLPDRAAQPDRAHLLFELAKFQTEYGLKADIRFTAGKDGTGAELFYTLDRDIVLDTAQVARLKSLFLATREGDSPVITGLHASPMTNSADGLGEPFPKDQAVPAWLPFGDASRDRAILGFAIASPLFYLAEGTRTITLRFPLTHLKAGAKPTPSQLAQSFKVYFSGEKDWLDAQHSSVATPLQWHWQGNTLGLTIKLGPEMGAIVPYHGALPGAQLPTALPVARLELRERPPSGQATSTFVSLYHFFQGVKFSQVAITTEVDAVRNLVLQNDLAVLDATKPFQPFGPLPKVGSHLYIGSQEVFQKPLTALALTITFETDKRDWATYYAGYGDTAPNPGKVKVQALRGKTWRPDPAIEKDLFTFKSYAFAANELGQLTLNQAEATAPLTPWTHLSQNGFLRLQLTGEDFRHGEYAKVLSRQVLSQAMLAMPQPQAVVGAYYRVPTSHAAEEYTVKLAASSTLNQLLPNPNSFPEVTVSQIKPVIPNEPFTPVIQSLSLGYTAQDTLKLTDLGTPQKGQIFHLHPFDRFVTLSPAATDDLLPHFNQAGELFIGLENLQPLTTLNLLFQVAEETADTRLKTAPVSWHYLVDNTWKPFEDYQIISDSTHQLIGSGIVQLAIPADIRNTQTTRLDPALHWLKVSVPDRSRAIPHIIGIHAQAAPVTFADAGNDPHHLATPLPAGTIAKLADPPPEVKAIAQPYATFGGRPVEQPQDYYTRISEHLRHKGRAVTIFDYERIVLERFPEIYKVRCINHGQVSDRDRLQEMVPGAVTLAVIPDLSKRRTTNDLQPKVNINLLAKIQADIQQFCSPWVDLQVVNPRYEEIQVEFEVKFNAPYEANFNYYRRELEQAIVGFLSPWTTATGADIHFGGKVYRSAILNFVEEQPTVDYVLNFRMHQGTQRDIREFVAPTARSILVSVPPSTASPPGPGHLITPASSCPPTQPLISATLGYTPLGEIVLAEDND